MGNYDDEYGEDYDPREDLEMMFDEEELAEMEEEW